MSEPTDTEIATAAEAGWRVAVDALGAAPWERQTEGRRNLYRQEVAAVLAAVLPEHDQRIRRHAINDVRAAMYAELNGIEAQICAARDELDRWALDSRAAVECDVCNGTGTIDCWSPGGPCPEGQTVCESCGPCRACAAAVDMGARNSAGPLPGVDDSSTPDTETPHATS